MEFTSNAPWLLFPVFTSFKTQQTLFWHRMNSILPSPYLLSLSILKRCNGVLQDAQNRFKLTCLVYINTRTETEVWQIWIRRFVLTVRVVFFNSVVYPVCSLIYLRFLCVYVLIIWFFTFKLSFLVSVVHCNIVWQIQTTMFTNKYFNCWFIFRINKTLKWFFLFAAPSCIDN